MIPFYGNKYLKPKIKWKHFKVISQLPCQACGYGKVNLHHVKTKLFRMRSHLMVIPLCPDCHQTGKSAIHRRPKKFIDKYGEPMDILLDVFNQLANKGELLPEPKAVYQALRELKLKNLVSTNKL